MTLAQFRTTVAAFMQRDEASFTVGGTNLLTRCINMARRWAERQRNFELCKVSAYLPSVHYTDGAALSGTVLLSDKVTPVVTKTILRAYLPFVADNQHAAGTTFPVDLISHDAYITRIQKHYENVYTTDPRTQLSMPRTSYFSVFRWGEYIYAAPADPTALGGTTFAMGLDVVKWLPAYALDADTDFFLEYCEDFLLMRTVHFLNYMLKEDQRVPVSANALADSWQTVVAWDSSLILNSSQDANLE
jgi:hypothetical protein